MTGLQRRDQLCAGQADTVSSRRAHWVFRLLGTRARVLEESWQDREWRTRHPPDRLETVLMDLEYEHQGGRRVMLGADGPYRDGRAHTEHT